MLAKCSDFSFDMLAVEFVTLVKVRIIGTRCTQLISCEKYLKPCIQSYVLSTTAIRKAA